MTFNAAQIEHISDILMAAVHADGEAQGIEDEAARAAVSALTGAPLSGALAGRMKGFKLAAFDLQKSAAALGALSVAQRKELLSHVARVTDSDDVHDLDESDFIVKLGKAIGASRDEYAGLTITLEAAAPPPPLPTKG